ncbi:hypothetical protein LXA43DRAFT_981306 [Ganoderma leucocontextum]|nr:hypothetical protein LXA43DRAFT_981306 [Ganoderma leucocontextum]
MHLTFSPDLGQTTNAKVAPVPPHILDRASCIHTLLFKATFDSPQSYLRARSDRFRVELWTNFPVHGHARHSGEWRAVQFTEPEQVQGTSASAQSFSLLTEADGKPEENTLYLRLRASLQDHVGARFSYTFRLVHASGHVEWLGSHKNNGAIVVEQGIPGVSLSKEWDVRNDGRFGLGASRTGKPLMRLDRPKEWSGWVWKPSSSLPTQFGGTGSCEGRAMVLLPWLSTNLGDSLKPLVLVAGESSTLRLDVDGNITVDSVDSTRRATLAALEHAQDLLEEAAALCHGAVLSFDSMSAVTIPLQKLQLSTASTSECHGLVLFSPNLRKAKLQNAPLPSDGGFLQFGPSGGELLVSPASVVCENDRTWQVTLLTPARQFTVRTERPAAPQILPTPPPSPPARDSSPASGRASSEVPDADHPSTKTSPDDMTRPVRSSPAPSSSSGGEARRSTHRRRRSLSMVLVRSLPARLIRTYLHAIFNVVFWFWSVFAKAFAVRLIGEGIPQAITRLLGLALAKTAARSRTTGTSRASAPTNGVEPSDAARASRRESTRAPSATDDSNSDSSQEGDESIPHPTPNRLGARVHPEPDVPVAAPSSLPLSSGLKEQGEALQSVPRVVVSAALLREQSSPTMLVRGPGLVKDLCGTFDGKPLPSPSVTPLEDGVFLVEFTELDGEGELKVSFEL